MRSCPSSIRMPPQLPTSDFQDTFSHTTSFCSTKSKPISMPSPNRNQYFNTRSTNINADLRMGTNNQTPTNGSDSVMNSEFIPPVLFPTVSVGHSNAETLAQTLLHPPPHAFLYGILSMKWVIGAVGIEHFDLREADGRYVLKRGSVLADMVAQGWLPAMYWEWLCGGEEDLSGATAADMDMYMTREFFAELEIESWWEDVERELEEELDSDGNGNGDGLADVSR